MNISPLAGKPAEPSMLVNVPRLVTAYFAEAPDAAVPGVILVFAQVDRRMRVDLQAIPTVIKPQDIITKDNVSIRVYAALDYRGMDCGGAAQG